MRPEVFTYRIDGDDTIIWVSDNWTSFAEANSWAAAVHPDEVVGHPLWEFVHGAETRYVYRELFRLVREGHRPNPIPFRCDSPGERRFCELAMTAGKGGRIEIESRILRTEPHRRAGIMDIQAERTEEILTICSMCKKIKVLPEQWVELDEALAQLRLFEAERFPMLSHGLCPSCREVFRQELEEFVRQRGGAEV